LASDESLVIHGWSIFAHPLFLNQFEELLRQVESLRQKSPKDYKTKNKSKRLMAIAKLAFDVIPQDPTLSIYRQGTTLGDDYKHWFRAKFFQQYRLFFRYHLESKILVFAWVNDENTKRAYDSNTDAYKIFKQLLDSGNLPDNWNSLLKDAESENNRLGKAFQSEI
jgi:toxin YhaV